MTTTPLDKPPLELQRRALLCDIRNALWHLPMFPADQYPRLPASAVREVEAARAHLTSAVHELQASADVFYEVTLSDGETCIDVHVWGDGSWGVAASSAKQHSRAKALGFIRRGFYSDPELPDFVKAVFDRLKGKPQP